MDDFVNTMSSDGMWLFCYVIFGLHALASVVKTVEWAIFEKKW